MLAALERVDARATFFVVAPLAERYPSLLRQAAEAGHEVSLHCTRHLRHDRMAAGEVLADARDGLRVLRRLGHETGDWRVPWGLVIPSSRKVAEDLGLRLVGWTADTGDWRGADAGEMLSRVAPGLEPGAIVLMHDGVGPGAPREGCAETVGLVGPLVGLARSRGLEPVPVGELSGPLADGNPGVVAGV